MRSCILSFRVRQHGKELDHFYVIRDEATDRCYNNSNCLASGIGAIERYNECLNTMKSLADFAGGGYEVIEE